MTTLAAQLFTNFQTTFQHRNAIVRRVTNKSGHLFEESPLTEPTKCSHCNGFIWGFWGQQCKGCRLNAHRRCLQAIETPCTSDQLDLPASCPHRIESKTFAMPTQCDHCGRFLKGFIRQGVTCILCSRSVHHDCKVFHFALRPCQPRGESTTKPHENDIYQHQSRIRIEDFEILRLIGTGSFSKVYLARFRNDDQAEDFAIKVVKKTNPVVNSDPESLFTEWKALNLGRSYPFLTIGHCCFQSRDRLFFVMEHVLGRDLYYHLTIDRKFTEYRAKYYAAEIVLALSYLHKQRIIYRDLKLDNIILDQTGHCKLLDFGMSKILTSERMRTRTFCGTPSYISPEVLRGDEYDYSTDWWSLGVLLFEMLAGFSPFEAQTEEATYEAIKHAHVGIPESLSARARSILEGLLTKEPQLRLGCQLIEGCERALREHPFFLFQVNNCEIHQWEELECKQIRPPHRPVTMLSDQEVQDEAQEKLTNFTPIGLKELRDVSQSEFQKFSFYSESFEDLANL